MTRRMFANLFQHAYVTTDLARAKDVFAADWGVTSWFEMQPTLDLRTPRGAEQAHLKIALAFVGDLQIELIEPVGGSGARIYQDALPATGFATVWHHFGFRLPGPLAVWEEWRAGVGNETYPIAIEGDLGFLKYVYLDTRARLGHYCEYIWSSQDLDAPVPRN